MSITPKNPISKVMETTGEVEIDDYRFVPNQDAGSANDTTASLRIVRSPHLDDADVEGHRKAPFAPAAEPENDVEGHIRFPR